MRLLGGIALARKLFSEYKYGAKRRGFEWSLSFDEFYGLTQRVCYICGSPPCNLFRNTDREGHFIYNGIDRVDNTLGYTPTNSKACCSFCNNAKGVLPLEKFLEKITKIVRLHDSTQNKNNLEANSAGQARGKVRRPKTSGSVDT